MAPLAEIFKTYRRHVRDFQQRFGSFWPSIWCNFFLSTDNLTASIKPKDAVRLPHRLLRSYINANQVALRSAVDYKICAIRFIKCLRKWTQPGLGNTSPISSPDDSTGILYSERSTLHFDESLGRLQRYCLDQSIFEHQLVNRPCPEEE